jgi:HEAT repeat protein/thiol-disulfide isomerase/thioredoxin
MRCCNDAGTTFAALRPWVVALLMGVCLLVRSTQAASPTAKLTHHASISAATEAASVDQSLVLVLFGAEWCGPCKLLKQDTLSTEKFLKGAGALRMVEIDIDADQKTANAYDVGPVPTLVLMTADGKIAARTIGYMDVTQMLQWLDEGRLRVKNGQWEGTAPGLKLNEFVAKAAVDRLEEADLKKLIALLGEPDPSDRASAAKLVLAQRESAMAPLIDELGNPYLGVRIGASELLQKLAPDAAKIDPWQSPKELSDAVASLKKWWADNNKLPSPTEARKADVSQLSSIKAAVETLRANDGSKRTEAMSALVAQGEAALPEIRDAIKRSDKAGDHRAVSLLEDVRWSILISDAVEQRANARAQLARGTGQERQAAATRLGRAGRDAIPALSELVNDTDPLVIENAVRALSNVGGKDTIPAMAALLKASDSNLRMTAAQGLGHTKDASATTPLLKAVGDSNEVVACTALAALTEIHGRENEYSTSKRTFPPELISTLKSAFTDARWRVRAAAVEVTGKLPTPELKDDVKKLLEDADGFVVKNALTSLAAMSTLPQPEQLAALARRSPSMRGEALRLMAKSAAHEAVPVATELYTNSSPADRLSLLGALTQHDRFDSEPLDEAWQPFIALAAKEPDVKLRRAAAVLLGRLPTKTAAEMIDGPLADNDREVRSATAEMVLWIISGRETKSPFAGMMGMDEDDLPSRNSAGKTNELIATPARRAAWREAMLKHGSDDADSIVAAAVYVTGDGKADVPLLTKALGKLDSSAAQKLALSPAMTLLLPKLAWPESEPVLQGLTNSPALYAAAASKSFTGAPPIRAYFTNAARLRAVLERASDEELSIALPLVLRVGAGVALLSPSAAMREMARDLSESTNAGCRAAGVFALGYQDVATALPVATNALRDPHPGVRVAAVQSVARLSRERKDLEERVAPMMSDTNLNVAEMAALALIEPEIRNAAGMEMYLQYFVYENVQVYSSRSFTMESDERPIVALDTKPAYLELARAQIRKNTDEDMRAFALLLAQHGDPEGIPLLTKPSESRGGVKRGEGSTQVALTAIALTGDTKYVPTLRAMLEGTKGEWELRAILRALRGMSGPEVRQLRLEINKQMRKATE